MGDRGPRRWESWAVGRSDWWWVCTDEGRLRCATLRSTLMKMRLSIDETLHASAAEATSTEALSEQSDAPLEPVE